MHARRLHSRSPERLPLKKRWAVVLLVLLGFLQVQGLRPDWHAAAHADRTSPACCAHDAASHGERAPARSPEDRPAHPLAHNCEFTALAEGMTQWAVSTVPPAPALRATGAVVLVREAAPARRPLAARARAPPQGA